MRAIKLLSILAIGAFVSCNQQPSLQNYFVENSEKSDFIAVDLSPSMLNITDDKLTAEQKSAMGTIRKMNVITYKLNDNNMADFKSEKAKVESILADPQYQELMRIGEGDNGLKLSFVGTKDDIEEVVLFASNEENGFAVARILGEDMTPTSVMTIMEAVQKADIDMSKLKPLQSILMSQPQAKRP